MTTSDSDPTAAVSQLADGSPILIGLDFDGTLTPIRPRPDMVELSEDVRATLARLAAVPRVSVAIVSGRGLRDLVGRVGLSGLIYAGNHGLEIEGPGLSFVEPTAASLSGRLEEIAQAISTRLADVAGVLLERKGLTASVHYRNVEPGRRDDVAWIVASVVSSDPDRFVVTAGHRVWEVRPRVDWHKGRALAWIMDRLGGPGSLRTLYLGDDRTDEDAFAVLPPDAVTVRVGEPSAPTLARYRLSDTDAVKGFLNRLSQVFGA